MGAGLSDERFAIGSRVRLEYQAVPAERGMPATGVLAVICCECGEEIFLLGDGDDLDVFDNIESHINDWCGEQAAEAED
ncbi:hypothetical protein ACWIGW_44750 [Nocardia brasiliensis]|uniref:hypothetical protein n=1 Tax=Streptomyces sp. NPDC056056 TaxID=3345698 RepID=UPI0035DC4D05